MEAEGDMEAGVGAGEVGLETDHLSWDGVEMWRETGLGWEVQGEDGGGTGAWWGGAGVSGRALGAPDLAPLGAGLSTVPVRAVMMTLEKSSKGTLELVEKMMFIRMMQRMKLVTLATRRKAQARSSKSGEGREAGTPGQALRPQTWQGEGLQGA